MKQIRIILVIICTTCLASCQPETMFTLQPNSLQMKVGDISTIEVVGNATNIVWSSSNEDVATVYHGVITAKAIGATTITAESGKTKVNAQVFVSGTDGATLRITPAVVEMKKGDTYQLQYGNSYDLPVVWSSSDESIATVTSDGLVTAHKGGNATISLSTNIETTTALIAVAHQWGEYKLVWADEFNGTELDLSSWTIQKGGGGWGNREAQYYTDRTENLRVENGHLIIEARKEQYDNNEYTSARIMSKDKRTFTYGKMEASISLPSGGGLWPAFWMLGNTGTWPACGEIDIMEYVGNVPNRIIGTLHTTKDRSGSKSSRQYWGENIENNFHTYGIEWTQEEKSGRDVIRFYVDGEVYSEQIESHIDNHDYWPFYKPHFFILNVAVGGTLGGNINPATFDKPCLMKVDWVRVYQREEIE